MKSILLAMPMEEAAARGVRVSPEVGVGREAEVSREGLGRSESKRGGEEGLLVAVLVAPLFPLLAAPVTPIVPLTSSGRPHN